MRVLRQDRPRRRSLQQAPSFCAVAEATANGDSRAAAVLFEACSVCRRRRGREQPCPVIKAVINAIQWPDAFACICCNDTLDNHALFALARTSQSRGVCTTKGAQSSAALRADNVLEGRDKAINSTLAGNKHS